MFAVGMLVGAAVALPLGVLVGTVVMIREARQSMANRADISAALRRGSSGEAK